jgi:2-amino-4-hydroxy-6-hydroxymethyldihydropteridine diphosphokinase/dihydropteroate synthase
MNVILGLGSNLMDRVLNITNAIKQLEDLKILKNITCSAIYESQALMSPNAPKSWDKDYYNIVIGGDSNLLPQQMLISLKKIEKSLGRDLEASKWSPRVIDIDILAYKDHTINTDELTIPHKLLFTRKWAIMPFFEIAPDWEFACNPEGYNTTSLAQIITELKFDDSLFIKVGKIT